MLDKEVVQRLSQRSDYKGLVQLAGHLALLAFTTLALAQAEGSLGCCQLYWCRQSC